ncbi:MAG: NAD(P)(+) transhydrogenase (Re/Si-specific) subunit beta [Bradymonadaceae bacterium]
MSPAVELAYLGAAVLFALGLKRMQSPTTARRGNAMTSAGMAVAVVATLFAHQILSPWMILAGAVLGGGIGAVLALRVEMTAMPELVAVFNGFGGLASALVAGAEVARYAFGAEKDGIAAATAVPIGLSVLIGTVTFSGSVVANGKLAGWLPGDPMNFPGMRVLTAACLLGAAGAGVYFGMNAAAIGSAPGPALQGAVGLGGVALVLGVLLVVPIGGADMPVVVALLNSYSGLAAAATGFVLSNTALIVSGTLVGAAGLILTIIMCDAMNRSLAHVLLGGFGAEGGGPEVDVPEGKTVKETSPQDTAILASYAENVVIVPGYGMAVAQAQHAVKELVELLEDQGIDVKFAIHPVAGRMPGHMNVLLAEADVSYDKLWELEDVNPEFENTDLSIVIGANDVVNPAAREAEGDNPIAGMPILNVDESDTVVVCKRSLSPGYSGVPNNLFYEDNAKMLFGDAKAMMSELVDEAKELSEG